MTARRRRSPRSSWTPVAVAATVAVLTAACAAGVDVATERADPIGVVPGEWPSPEPDPPEVAAIVWASCAGFGMPDRVPADAWECAVVEAPMDPFAAGPSTLAAC